MEAEKKNDYQENNAAGFQKLHHNLIDMVKEDQAKLGYFDGDIRLYYPLSTLNHFFESEDDAAKMLERLSVFPKSWKETLGDVKVTASGERFCFLIPKEGNAYVKNALVEDKFIKDLIALVKAHGTTLADIEKLFYEKSTHVEKKVMDNGEFDCAYRILDDEDNPYYYCFKDEGCHIIYHRFLPADYEDFHFE